MTVPTRGPGRLSSGCGPVFCSPVRAPDRRTLVWAHLEGHVGEGAVVEHGAHLRLVCRRQRRRQREWARRAELRVETPDARVAIVSHHHAAVGVDRNTSWVAEVRARSRAISKASAAAARQSRDRSVGRDLANAVAALLRHDRISIAIDCDAKRLTKVRFHGVPVGIAVNATAGEPAAEQERVWQVRMMARERQASPLGYRSGQVPTV